jgi:hypothetical protein
MEGRTACPVLILAALAEVKRKQAEGPCDTTRFFVGHGFTVRGKTHIAVIPSLPAAGGQARNDGLGDVFRGLFSRDMKSA